jgi:hypothetical protein
MPGKNNIFDCECLQSAKLSQFVLVVCRSLSPFPCFVSFFYLFIVLFLIYFSNSMLNIAMSIRAYFATNDGGDDSYHSDDGDAVAQQRALTKRKSLSGHGVDSSSLLKNHGIAPRMYLYKE